MSERFDLSQICLPGNVGFYLSREQRDEILLHLVDISCPKGLPENHLQARSKKLIKVLLSLSEGSMVGEQKDLNCNQPPTQAIQGDLSNSDEQNAESSNTVRNRQGNLTESDLFGSLSADLSDVDWNEDLHGSSVSSDSCIYIGASVNETGEGNSGDSIHPTGEQQHSFSSEESEREELGSNIEAVLERLEADDDSNGSLCGFPNKLQDRTRPLSTPLDENNNQISASTSKRPPSPPIDPSNSQISSTTTSNPTDDESTDRQSEPESSVSEYDDEPQKKRSKRQISQRSRSGSSNQSSSGQKCVERRFFTQVKYLNQKIRGGGTETVVYVSVDQLEQLQRSEQERYSQAFDCKQLEWRVKVRSRDGYMDVFLECMNIQQSDCLSSKASIEVVLVNRINEKHVNSSKTYSKKIDVRFDCEHDIHGLYKFYQLEKLAKQSNRFVRNDTVKLRITLKVLKQTFHQ